MIYFFSVDITVIKEKNSYNKHLKKSYTNKAYNLT